MRFSMDSNMQFPLVELSLNQGETVFIQRGSMVYHTPNVTLNTQLNASGSGLGRFVKAVGRSMVSGESTFITQAVAQSDNGYLALAPDSPGQVIPLQLGEKQYRLNDGAFLALDGTAYYTMERQSVGKAIFGSIKKIELHNQEVTIDNAHVVAWSQSLNYNIHLENGFWQSIGTGEGVVNTFQGTGEVYVQSLNLQTFAGSLSKFIPRSS